MLAGNLVQVFAETATVADRNLHQASFRQLCVGLLVQPRLDFLDQCLVGSSADADEHRVVVQRQGGGGGHNVQHTRWRRCTHVLRGGGNAGA